MEIKRKLDWQTRLHNFIDQQVQCSFAWGEHDCCLLIADEINAMTDVDLGADYRGKYSDAKSAVALIQSICGGSSAVDLFEHFVEQCGFQKLPSVLFAQRGDVVSLEDNTLGFVHLNGKDVVCYAQDDNLHIVPVAQALTAWRVL